MTEVKKQGEYDCVYDFTNVTQVVQSLVGSTLLISTNRAYEFSCHGNQAWLWLCADHI